MSVLPDYFLTLRRASVVDSVDNLPLILHKTLEIAIQALRHEHGFEDLTGLRFAISTLLYKNANIFMGPTPDPDQLILLVEVYEHYS